MTTAKEYEYEARERRAAKRKPATRYYHISPVANRDAILAGGLIGQPLFEGGPNVVFVFDDLRWQHNIAGDIVPAGAEYDLYWLTPWVKRKARLGIEPDNVGELYAVSAKIVYTDCIAARFISVWETFTHDPKKALTLNLRGKLVEIGSPEIQAEIAAAKKAYAAAGPIKLA